jgi:hypothetical protein
MLPSVTAKDAAMRRLRLSLCYLGLFALSACAQPPPAPAAVPAPPKAAAPAQPAAPPVAQPAAKDAPAMSQAAETAPTPSPDPPISAAELRKRILAMVDDLRSSKQLNRSYVEKMMRIEMREDPEDPGDYIYDGSVSEGWNFYVGIRKIFGPDEPPQIRMTLWLPEKTKRGMHAKICTYEYEEFAKEIEAVGYTRSSYRLARLGGKTAMGFGRNDSEYGLTVYVYSAENGSEEGRYCIQSILL